MAKKILIVDDEPDFLKVITARMRANGYDVLTAVDGIEAIKITREKKPDLIILDVMLPKKDGFSVCRTLKFDTKLQAIPILMLTARTDKKTGMEVGADAFLNKPFDPAALLATVKKLLKEE